MSHPEHAIHHTLADYLDARGLLHRPGLEGVLTRTQRIRAAQVGMREGWPDVHLPAQRGQRAVWIELKVPGKRPTREQILMMGALRASGDHVAWCDSVEAAVAFVESVHPA